ncbi:T9SS type B sorting domain-containing protein [uncultured Flavobacterium sp.]|uniref:T9SS type B sorting domain-containing protein n=1 Tax=uncultured Flavobacterium sp. TaxID=165435 RepID=UPI0025D4B093|nr:T9SS type B sorting domain-containing protein [uncultured Flavobacterium sp.]
MNNFTFPAKNIFFALCFSLFTLQAYSQLNVSVTVTDETCPGFGALSLSVSNANPAAPVVYKVYLLPEDTIPVWNSTESEVPALGDGEYLIIATQQIGSATTTGQANATIGSLYVPVAFYISNSVATCDSGTDMTVTATAGNPETYEIISGPVTTAPQASNVFTNVPSGTYEVRVTDECGNGFTATHSFATEPTTLTLAGPVFPDTSFPSCNSMNINYTVGTSSPSGIIYPLTVQMTVTPPDGGTPQVYNQTITAGSPTLLTINRLIDYYPEAYSVSISVTDPCGNVYESSDTVSQLLNATASVAQVSCDGQALTINATRLVAPYTIAFTAVPAGFDPALSNGSYPGPFNGPAVFGTESNPIPLGSYSGTITDACGRTDAFTREVDVPQAPEPQISAVNNNCQTQLGRVLLRVPNSELVTVVVVSAPAQYSEPLPYDASAEINAQGIISITGMVPGNYEINFTDSCGNSYTAIPVAIPQFSPQAPEYTPVPDCTAGMGSVKISPSVTQVTITAAPAGAGLTLPFNASSNIFEGDFSMDALPPGNYSFTVNTECENGYTQTVEIVPLSVTQDAIEVQPTCDDFSIFANYESNAGDAVTFWLQRFNESTDNWEHPGTGAPYTENDALTGTNALALSESNTGFTATGEFRILRQQTSYCMGSLGKTEKNCIEEVQQFEFYNELGITGIYNRTCVGEDFEVEVNATGVTPEYELISKDGDTSFYLDNGTNNIFTNLESALYVLRVTDACGEVRVEQFNIAELPPLITASMAEDMFFCDETGAGTGTFDLSQQDEAVLGEVDPDIAVITYHASQEDADQDINALPLDYTSGTATVYARVEWIVNPLCYGTSSFSIVASPTFELAMEESWGLCNGQPVTIMADPGYESYTWSTGEEDVESITVTEPGEYTVTVTNDAGCEVTKTLSAVVVSQPLIADIEIEDWSDNDNTVTIITDGTDASAYEYSFDGINYQDAAELTGVPAGIQTIYVRDKFGCYPPDSEEVMIATYPKYFSPNGDGANDTWRIKFAVLEPGLTVQIFDRYGKQLTNFGNSGEGWDGTFDGRAMPADDYWFIVKRGDGRQFKGHFSIKR